MAKFIERDVALSLQFPYPTENSENRAIMVDDLMRISTLDLGPEGKCIHCTMMECFYNDDGACKCDGSLYRVTTGPDCPYYMMD